MRGYLFSVALIIVLLVLICSAVCWQNIREKQSEDRIKTVQSEKPVASLSWADNLVKFGNPEPQKIAGPYHVLINEGYVSGYDAGIEDPLWVETRFFAVSNPSSIARPREFSTDERIEPQYQVNTSDWTDTGYDRGHMAPNWGVSICYGRVAQVQTFLLTNIVPQSPDLNRGLWETLEKIISNDYAERFGEVWVICGPIFGDHSSTLKDGKLLVPTACYKIILRVDRQGDPHALAFEMPQSIPFGHQQSDLSQYLTSISQLEHDAGIKFFPNLPVARRSQLESVRAMNLW